MFYTVEVFHYTVHVIKNLRFTSTHNGDVLLPLFTLDVMEIQAIPPSGNKAKAGKNFIPNNSPTHTHMCTYVWAQSLT